MGNPTGISRRIEQCIERLQTNDHEGALVNLFPAIDNTAKKRRHKDGVAKRIKGFLKDEEVLITAVGGGNVFKDCSFDGMSLEAILYKFGRTSIMHEGELDPRLSFDKGGKIQARRDNWILPVGYIAGMALAVIIAPENKGEQTADGLGITIFEKRFSLNEIWGKPDAVKTHVCAKFRNSEVFS